MKTSFEKFMASNAVVGSTNVELGAVKVDLALVDDIKIMVNALNSQKSIDDDVINKTVKILRPLQQLKKDGLDRFKTNDSVINSSITKIKLANDLLVKAGQMSKALGVDLKSVEGYDEVSKLIVVLEKNILRYREYQNELKQVI
jgi:hypothetical protein